MKAGQGVTRIRVGGGTNEEVMHAPAISPDIRVTRAADGPPNIHAAAGGRGRFVLAAEQWFPRPIEEVFAFFADAHNLNELTPPWLHFAIVTPRPIEMREGTLIDYRIRLKGVPMKWRTRISAWDPPFRFADEQIKGPYALWRHEHTFERRDEGTLMRDAVTYALPMSWAPGSGLVHTLVVRPDLTRIFTFRREAMAEKFG